jgi:hypothetical protein
MLTGLLFKLGAHWDLMIVVLTVIGKDQDVGVRYQVECVLRIAPDHRLNNLRKWH